MPSAFDDKLIATTFLLYMLLANKHVTPLNISHQNRVSFALMFDRKYCNLHRSTGIGVL